MRAAPRRGGGAAAARRRPGGGPAAARRRRGGGATVADGGATAAGNDGRVARRSRFAYASRTARSSSCWLWTLSDRSDDGSKRSARRGRAAPGGGAARRVGSACLPVRRRATGEHAGVGRRVRRAPARAGGAGAHRKDMVKLRADADRASSHHLPASGRSTVSAPHARCAHRAAPGAGRSRAPVGSTRAPRARVGCGRWLNRSSAIL